MAPRAPPKIGSSRLQGPHQDAQKVTITTLPRWLLKVMSSQVTRLRTLMSGAVVPMAGPDGASVATAWAATRMPNRRQQCFILRSMRRCLLNLYHDFPE